MGIFDGIKKYMLIIVLFLMTMGYFRGATAAIITVVVMIIAVVGYIGFSYWWINTGDPWWSAFKRGVEKRKQEENK